jgi:hypothetical protein
MVGEAAMRELQTIVSGAQEMTEGGITYIHLPQLKLPCAPGAVEALLCIQQHGGYTTRLFLSQPVPGKGNNWSTHQILGRPWHTWSWNNVPANLRPAEILTGHLGAFR